jgi:ariadne-1
MSDDQQLPRILENLLPRLLAKFDRINTTYAKDENERSRIDQIISQCTGIFSHAMDRIRLARTGGFCESLIEVISTFQSTATTTMAISLLQTGLPFFAAGPESTAGGLDISPVATLVHEAHQALSTSTSNPETRQSLGATPTAAQLLYRMSGWLLVDCIAVAAGLSPSSACAIPHDKAMNGWDMVNRLSAVAYPLDLSLDGVFHFVLDVLLYWPTSSSLTVRDPQNNADLVFPDNSTGLSTEGLLRMQSRNASNERLRQLKLVTLNYALPLCSQTVKTVGDNHDSSAASEMVDLRKRALAVVFDEDRFPHGRVARMYTNHLRSRSFRGQSQECTIPLTVYLLFLVLGDRAAIAVLNQTHSDIWEPIVGNPPAALGAGLLRGQLPLHVAARVVKFIRDGFQLSPYHDPRAFFDADEAKQLEVVVNLVVEMQNTSNDCLFWGIQLIHKFYSEIRVLFRNERGKAYEDFKRIFYRKCLDVCTLVLALLPDHVDIRLRSRTSNREVGRVNQMDIDEMEERQGHAEALVSVHRQRQKNRMLCGSDAALSRRLAYEMISEIVLDPTYDSSATRDLCLALFNWVPCEEDDSNDASKASALSSLFQVFLREVPNAAPDARDGILYAIIPHLLAAACYESPSARLVAIEWSSKLVAMIEPDVSMLICSHLSGDKKDVVSKLARQTVDALRLASTGTAVISTDQATTCCDIRLPECRSVVAQHLLSWLEQIQREFGLELDAALPVLIDHRFSIQEVLEALRSDFTGTLRFSGLGAQSADCGGPSDHGCLVASPQECGICFEEMDVLESIALRCRHAFCKTCWITYLSEQLKMVSLAGRLSCPNHKCQERVLMSDVSKIHEPLVAPYQDAVLTMLIESCDLYSSCPGPDCAMVACRRQRLPRPETVHCSFCSTSFCFRCRQEPHDPAECSDLEQWNRIYSSSKYWIQTNTKPCPTCKAPIEKNTGCNHMNCTICGTHFCWLCLSHMRLHLEVHSCNTYNPLDSADNDDERRAIFFTERFGSHREAELYCRKRLNHYESESASVADRHWYLSGDQLNDVCDAMEDIADARRFLQYSYVSAWARSIRRERGVARFTQLQASLENLTERLSTLALAANFESVYHDHRLASHFRTMSFLREALHTIMNRMRNTESKLAIDI